MRVLHVIPSLGGGGAERQVSYLAEGMSRQGADVHVAMLRGGPHLARVAACGATVHEIRDSGNYDPRLLPRTVRVVRSVQPDLIQTWLTQADILGGVAAMARRVPWILSERSSPQYHPWSWKKALRRAAGRLADAIVANSELGLAYWQASRAKKFVVPNAVDVEAIDAAEPAIVDVAISQRVVLYVGRLDADKNVDLLVRVLAEVLRTRDAVMLICGEGPRESELRAQIERSGEAGHFRLLGFTDAVWSLMKRADVLVSPSSFEGRPNAIIEAAVARCPLVLSDIPQHRVLFDDRSATFAPPRDPVALARAVQSVFDDGAEAWEKARRARAAVQEWTIDRVAADYLKIYEKVVS